MDEILTSYLTNLSLRAIPSITNLDYLLSLKLLTPSQIEKLLSECTEAVNTERNQDYSLGLNKRGHLLFETEFYSDYYYNLVEKTLSEKKQLIYNIPKVNSRFVQLKEKYMRTLIVDLEKEIDVKYLLLSFEKSDLRAKMRINVYRECG